MCPSNESHPETNQSNQRNSIHSINPSPSSKKQDNKASILPLYILSENIVLLTDASFDNSIGMKSQLVYIILMGDKNCRCNSFHYGSNKYQRIARSVIAADVQEIILGYNFAFIIKTMV